MLPVEESVKFTVNGASPLSGEPENAAVGAGGVAPDSVIAATEWHIGSLTPLSISQLIVVAPAEATGLVLPAAV